MTQNWNELVSLLKSVFDRNGIEIVRAVLNRIYQIHKLPADSKIINSIEDLNEVKSMLETNTKNWEKMAFETCIKKSQFEIVEKTIINGMSNTNIRKTIRMSTKKITQIRNGITQK